MTNLILHYLLTFPQLCVSVCDKLGGVINNNEERGKRVVWRWENICIYVDF